jgi:DNA-directed RNA polymerase beta subunit
MYATSFPIRYDTSCEVLDYPQKCLLSTAVGRSFGMHEMPSGINCVVAITNLGSWNAEDCIIMHKAAVERGLFHSTTYKTVTIEEYRPKSAHSYVFCLPEKTIRKEVYNYSLLDEEGIVKKGSHVKRRDVIVGCIMEVVKKGGKTREVIRKDCSELSDEEGIVESVEIFKTFLGHRMVKIIFKVRKIPERGDKFANLNAQKGTCGIQLNTEDMPFCCEDGIVPDIIVNPHALPSRMTISMLMAVSYTHLTLPTSP